MENSLSNTIWTLRMAGHAYGTDQCTRNMATIHLASSQGSTRPRSSGLPRRHPHLHQERPEQTSTTRRGSSQTAHRQRTLCRPQQN